MTAAEVRVAAVRPNAVMTLANIVSRICVWDLCLCFRVCLVGGGFEK